MPNAFLAAVPLSLLLLAGCRPDADRLPENHYRVRAARSMRKADVQGIRQTFIPAIEHMLSAIPSANRPIARGQVSLALRQLDDPASFGRQPPVALFGTYGLTEAAGPYIGVWVLNTNRETSALHCILTGPDDACVHLLYRRHLTEKDLDFGEEFFVEADFVTWPKLLSLAAKDADGRLVVTRENDERMPFPVDEQIAAAAAVEDRSGRLSNFVPLSRWDRIPSSSASDDDGPEAGGGEKEPQETNTNLAPPDRGLQKQ